MTTAAIEFIRALTTNSLVDIRRLPKGDRHCHLFLGGWERLLLDHDVLRTASQIIRETSPDLEKAFSSIIRTITGILTVEYGDPIRGLADLSKWFRSRFAFCFDFDRRLGFILMACATLKRAKIDGITVLHVSVNADHVRLFPGGPVQLRIVLERAKSDIIPKAHVEWHIGCARESDPCRFYASIERSIDSGAFCGIDLYGEELARDVRVYRPHFQLAREAGWRCKAHVGEFGAAGSVRDAVEVLGITEVQHGFRAAESEEVLEWLAAAGIIMNLAPSTCLRLGSIESYHSLRIRSLVDCGVRLTLSSDDALLTGLGVSDEFVRCHQEERLPVETCESMRLTSLSG